MKDAFKIKEIEKGKLLRNVRVFEAKRDLRISEKVFLVKKGDILEEKFNEPNKIHNTSNATFKTLSLDVHWSNESMFKYKGTIPAEKSKYFQEIGLNKIGAEKKRKLKAISKANDRIAEIDYFLNL